MGDLLHQLYCRTQRGSDGSHRSSLTDDYQFELRDQAQLRWRQRRRPSRRAAERQAEGTPGASNPRALDSHTLTSIWRTHSHESTSDCDFACARFGRAHRYFSSACSSDFSESRSNNCFPKYSCLLGFVGKGFWPPEKSETSATVGAAPDLRITLHAWGAHPSGGISFTILAPHAPEVERV